MAVDPSKAFTRRSWNEDIIREVNELCENPDTGCDPLPTLDEAERDHIWAKIDVTEVQDKLVEICSENTFDDMNTPQLWHYNDIIVPIEEAIERGWCGCEPTETEFDFGYFPQTNYEAAWKASAGDPAVDTAPGGCGGIDTTTYTSPYYPVPSGNAALNSIRVAARNAIYFTLKPAYSSAVYAVFAAEDVIEVIEEEITVIEGQIIAIEDDITNKEAEITEATTLRDYYCAEGPPSECATYTTLVTTLEGDLADLEDDLQVKEGELEVKETELAAAEADLDSKITTRTTVRTEWDVQAQVMWAAYQSMELQWEGDIQPARDLFPAMDEPWGDYWEDTRNQVKGKWYFMLDQHNNGVGIGTMAGDFSPGGYPYYIGPGTQRITRVPNLCRYFEYTYDKACLCPWQIPGQGTEDCEGTVRIWWRGISFGILQVLGEDCCCVAHDDWRLTFRIKHSPDYTR